MSSDLELVEQYVRRESEEAFASLVRRHLDLVYSAALRQVRSPQLAEEVAQSTFADLARQAARLGPDTVLAAWLYQVARRTAIDVVRREARRQRREQVACELTAMNATAPDWTHIEPLLDEAMDTLEDHDRAAVLLRYFESKSLREVGQSLGVSDDAAQKRVSRAVDRLREFLARRGVAVGASGLVAVISAHAVQAAPAGLLAAISTAAAVAGTTATTATATTTTLAMTALQKGLVTATLSAALMTSVFLQQRHQSRMREADQRVQQQANRLAELQAQNGRLSNLAALANSRNREEDLLRLRGEAVRLRRQTNDLVPLQEENRRLRAGPSRVPTATKTPLQIKEEGMIKLTFSKYWALAFLEFAEKNQGQFPTNLDQAAAFLPDNGREEATALSDQLEIVYQGSRDAVTNPARTIVLREKEAWQFPNGNWERVYVFADGHSEIHAAPDGRFEAWEQERILTPSGP